MLFGKRSDESRPERGLCGKIFSQKCGGSKAGRKNRNKSGLFYRGKEASHAGDRDIRDGKDFDEGTSGFYGKDAGYVCGGNHRGIGSSAADIFANFCIRAFREKGASLGEDMRVVKQYADE